MSSRCPLVAVALASVCLLLVASAPPPACAGPEPPSLVATAYNTQRKLARAGDGTLYAAVTVNASGIPAVRVLSTLDGSAWTVLPSPPAANESDRTSLAIDSRGWLHLAWTEVTSTARQVLYSRFEAGYWTLPEQLSHSAGYAGFPSLAVDAANRVHLAWYATPDGVNYQIVYRRLEASAWTPERALSSASSDATNPALAVGPDGAVHVAWSRLPRPTALETEIAYVKLQGNEVSGEVTISEPSVSAATPSLVVARNGTVHAAWSGDGHIQHVEWEGRWLAVETVTSGAPAAENPSLALDPLDRLHVVWEGADGSLYHQARNGTWSSPEVFASGGRNFEPSARWAQFHDPLCGPNAGVDVIWTKDTTGVLTLEYRRIDAPLPCPIEGGPGPAVWAAAGIAAAAAGAGFVLLARRRRARAPPGNPP